MTIERTCPARPLQARRLSGRLSPAECAMMRWPASPRLPTSAESGDVSMCPNRRAVASTLATVLATAALAAQQPTFKSGSKTVAIYATVSDKSGRLVPDLAADDFEVRDEGKPQALSVFSNEVQP